MIINCFNGELFLKEAIDSVYAQTFQDWEIILWDNKSTDGTKAIAQSYDQKLRYFCSKETVPLGAARNLAVTKAKGEWIGFLDSDDRWFPDKLSIQLKAVEGTDYILCYAGRREIAPDGKKIRDIIPKFESGWMLEQQLEQFDINMVTPIISRAALGRNNLNFDENLTTSEEYNLFMRLAAKGPFSTIPFILGEWRISENSMTNQTISKWHEERHYTLDQLKEENPGIDLKYPKAFREASARGFYYKSRYLVVSNRRKEARETMRSISNVNIKYKILWVSLYVPFLWDIINSDFLKRRILPRILRINKWA